MSLPNYQISIVSPTDGSTRAVLDGTAFDDLKFSRSLNDVSLFAATLPFNDQWAEIFTLDALIDVQRTSPVTGRL